MVNNDRYVFSKLSNFFDTDSFSCGKAPLDTFIKRYALINQRNNLGQTWVLHEDVSTTIIGYYTLSAANVVKNDLPSEFTTGFPHYPIPCVLIGKLAVSNKHQKKGFGKQLLYDALSRIKNISLTVGCNAVIVEALDTDVVNFYKKYGFIQFVDRGLSLFLPIKSIP